MNRNIRNLILLSIALISFFMHYEHFPKDLMSVHVWRQAQTQSTINNFYEEDMNILNPRRNDRGGGDGIFRMEFPLMQWIVASVYKIFGSRLIITRVFMFLLGLITILGLYLLINQLFHNVLLSLMGAWALNFSPIFYYYTINPLPDNMALCCGIWGLAMFFRWYNKKRILNLIVSGLLISVAALCKLPFIMYFIVPLIYFLPKFYRRGITKDLIWQAVAVFAWGLLPFAWYISVIPQWQGNPIVEGILNNKESVLKLLDYLQDNLISTLPEMLLNYGSLPLFLAGFYFLWKHRSYKDERFPMILGLSVIVLVYFFFELNTIAKVHDYYLFPFLPLLFILVAYGAYNLFNLRHLFFRYFTIFLLLLLPFTCYLRMQIRWDPESPGFNRDLLVYKDDLRNAVPSDALVVAGNDISHFIMFYYIDKRGWGFENNNLTADTLEYMIDHGARYLYTDSDEVLSGKRVKSCLDHLVMTRGSIKVYELTIPLD